MKAATVVIRVSSAPPNNRCACPFAEYFKRRNKYPPPSNISAYFTNTPTPPPQLYFRRTYLVIIFHSATQSSLPPLSITHSHTHLEFIPEYDKIEERWKETCSFQRDRSYYGASISVAASYPLISFSKILRLMLSLQTFDDNWLLYSRGHFCVSFKRRKPDNQISDDLNSYF